MCLPSLSLAPPPRSSDVSTPCSFNPTPTPPPPSALPATIHYLGLRPRSPPSDAATSASPKSLSLAPLSQLRSFTNLSDDRALGMGELRLEGHLQRNDKQVRSIDKRRVWFLMIPLRS
ncbi:hypothetical protein DAI22_10g051100 [Oryza sativa Japonica Group]|nr:hypothetical protein DAI22_10g051100 [Oryza sativa Japonica Group]